MQILQKPDKEATQIKDNKDNKSKDYANIKKTYCEKLIPRTAVIIETCTVRWRNGQNY